MKLLHLFCLPDCWNTTEKKEIKNKRKPYFPCRPEQQWPTNSGTHLTTAVLTSGPENKAPTESWSLKEKRPTPTLPCTQKSTTTGLMSGKSALEQPHLTSSQINGFIKAINAIWGKSAVVPQDKHTLYQPPGEKQGSVRTEHVLPPPIQISTSIQWEGSPRTYFFKALKQLNLSRWKKKQQIWDLKHSIWVFFLTKVMCILLEQHPEKTSW